MERRLPTVWNVWGAGREWMELDVASAGERVVLDSPGWFAWLAAESTRRFAYAIYERQLGYTVGFLTVRKERRQRGGAYWVAYRRLGGQVCKVYIGSSEAVTGARLQAIACQLRGKEVASNEQTGE
jgi:LuxR family transcriptional regulator, maltose regulon positive regulatory protein